MADDEVRPASPPPRPAADPAEEAVPGGAAAAPAQEATPEREPGMADAGADLAADRPAESFAPAPAGRRSAMPALLATIGAVLIVLLGINLYMMANPPGQGALATLQTEMAGLRQRVGSLESRAVPSLEPLDTRVKALDAAVAKLGDDLAGVRTQASGDFAGKLEALDSRVTALDKAAADLRRTAVAPAAVAAVGDEVAAVKAAVAALPRIDLGRVETRLAALEARLKPLEDAFSAPKIAANVTEARQVGSADETRAAPRAVTAQAILQALDEGKPFAAEVATLQALGVDEAKLAAMRPVATTGAPTGRALADGFADRRGALVQAAAPKVTGTVLDRVVASAQSLVKVRPAGASPGSDPDAIASRIAAALDRGAFRTALDEWEQLPEASRDASMAWADRLKQRVAAEEAARAVAAAAIAAIGASH